MTDERRPFFRLNMRPELKETPEIRAWADALVWTLIKNSPKLAEMQKLFDDVNGWIND